MDTVGNTAAKLHCTAGFPTCGVPEWREGERESQNCPITASVLSLERASFGAHCELRKAAASLCPAVCWSGAAPSHGKGAGGGCSGLPAALRRTTSREAAQRSMTQALKHLGRGHVILISFFVLNRKGVCG